jgi:hypothetical protein
MARCCFVFSGEASGGTLIFCENRGGNARYVIIETVTGESAENAIARLAKTIDETNPFDWGGFPIGKNLVTSSGGELKGLVADCREYMIAGTETGLGIPKPPHSLTCNYNREANNISIRWVNPSPDAYDSIRIVFHRLIGGFTVQGKSESYVLDLNKHFNKSSELDSYLKEMGLPKDTYSNITSDIIIWVFGVRNDIPSNAAAIHLKNNSQEEIYGIPFTNGIAPNWQSWSLNANESKINLTMGTREEYINVSSQRYKPVKNAQTKPFYQIINTGTKGGTGGVYRKFIGLTSGHTYRVKTRVATLSEPNEGQWSVSVHAAINGPDEGDFSPRQMAGLDALTDGNKGDTAGRMALFDSSLTTKGQFVEISTDNSKTIRGKEITDITLSQGVDTITVWIKCTASASMSAAIDWISLEDLSA